MYLYNKKNQTLEVVFTLFWKQHTMKSLTIPLKSSIFWGREIKILKAEKLKQFFGGT